MGETQAFAAEEVNTASVDNGAGAEEVEPEKEEVAESGHGLTDFIKNQIELGCPKLSCSVGA